MKTFIFKGTDSTLILGRDSSIRMKHGDRVVLTDEQAEMHAHELPLEAVDGSAPATAPSPEVVDESEHQEEK